nr:hypothetical protein [Tanacetum cinerariifolium]
MGKREDVGDDLNGGVGLAIYRVKEAFMPKFSSWLRWKILEGVCVVWLEMEQQGDDVASWWPWNVFEVIESCYRDVMEPTPVLVKWLPFTNHDSNEAQTILVQMTYLIASLTLDSENSCVMQGASCTQRKVSVVSFGSISSDSFFPSILLLVVIMVTIVVVVTVILPESWLVLQMLISSWESFYQHKTTQILVQMTYLIASLTLDSENSCVMQGASCTQRKVSVVSFGSISSDSFLSSILLLVVIMVTIVVVVVTVILVIVVIAIVGVGIVVVIIGIVVVVGGVSFILKLLFVIIGWAYAFHQDKASSVREFLLVRCFYWDCRYFPWLQLVLPKQHQYHQQLIVGWQPESWLVLQMLISSWEAFYQHKTTQSKNL